MDPVMKPIISSEITDRAATKGFAYLNLIGDGIHNFVDGMVIAASFLTDSQRD